MEPVQDVATETVAEQAPGALHIISEERGQMGRNLKGAAVELETPDVAVIATNHRRGFHAALRRHAQ